MFGRAKRHRTLYIYEGEGGKKAFIFRKPFPIGRITERSSTLMSLLFGVRIYIIKYRYGHDGHGIYSEVVTLYHYGGEADGSHIGLNV